MDLRPYIFFYGRCEEALRFYQSVFGGSYEVMRVGDAPAETRRDMEGAQDDDVMHASFTSGAVSFFAADGMQRKAIDPDEGNIALALGASSAEEGERLCAALAEGGTLKMPFGNAFWGGKFGDVVDRFGNEWMISA